MLQLERPADAGWPGHRMVDTPMLSSEEEDEEWSGERTHTPGRPRARTPGRHQGVRVHRSHAAKLLKQFIKHATASPSNEALLHQHGIVLNPAVVVHAYVLVVATGSMPGASLEAAVEYAMQLIHNELQRNDLVTVLSNVDGRIEQLMCRTRAKAVELAVLQQVRACRSACLYDGVLHTLDLMRKDADLTDGDGNTILRKLLLFTDGSDTVSELGGLGRVTAAVAHPAMPNFFFTMMGVGQEGALQGQKIAARLAGANHCQVVTTEDVSPAAIAQIFLQGQDCIRQAKLRLAEEMMLRSRNHSGMLSSPNDASAVFPMLPPSTPTPYMGTPASFFAPPSTPLAARLGTPAPASMFGGPSSPPAAQSPGRLGTAASFAVPSTPSAAARLGAAASFSIRSTSPARLSTAASFMAPSTPPRLGTAASFASRSVTPPRLGTAAAYAPPPATASPTSAWGLGSLTAPPPPTPPTRATAVATSFTAPPRTPQVTLVQPSPAPQVAPPSVAVAGGLPAADRFARVASMRRSFVMDRNEAAPATPQLVTCASARMSPPRTATMRPGPAPPTAVPLTPPQQHQQQPQQRRQMTGSGGGGASPPLLFQPVSVVSPVVTTVTVFPSGSRSGTKPSAGFGATGLLTRDPPSRPGGPATGALSSMPPQPISVLR